MNEILVLDEQQLYSLPVLLLELTADGTGDVFGGVYISEET